MNMWKTCVYNKVEVNYPLCDLIIPQTLSQKFHECHKANLAWALVASIIYWLKHPLVQVQGTMQKLSFYIYLQQKTSLKLHGICFYLVIPKKAYLIIPKRGSHLEHVDCLH
jgi:hypothetical protein